MELRGHKTRPFPLLPRLLILSRGEALPSYGPFSALLSATAACALILSCGIFALTGAKNLGLSPYVAENQTSYTETYSEEDTETTVEYTTVNE